MALDVICWMWGNKYKPEDVFRLGVQVQKHFKKTQTRFTVFTDREYPELPYSRLIKDRDLCDRHCFCRLRMFDPEWQKQNGFEGWLASLDLDLVITGPLDDVFKPRADFMILQGVNAVNPNPFNASLMLLRTGTHAQVWNDFSLEAAQTIRHHEFPDDQGWIWHKLPNAQGWQVGHASGIYGFQKPGWPGGFQLPVGARIVSFIGKRKPQMYIGLPWVKANWVDVTRG